MSPFLKTLKRFLCLLKSFHKPSYHSCKLSRRYTLFTLTDLSADKSALAAAAFSMGRFLNRPSTVLSVRFFDSRFLSNWPEKSALQFYLLNVKVGRQFGP